MNKKVHKWFWVWDLEKEEKWLNKMSALGFELVHVSFITYVFKEGIPSESSYRIEFLENQVNHPVSTHYINFLEEANVKYIGNVQRTAYFKIESSEVGKELFSDIDSKIKHLDRMTKFMLPLMIIQFIAGINNLHLYFSQGYKINLIISIAALALGFIFEYGFLRILLMKNRLKKERILHE